jgi:hypothetical protein
VLETIRVFVLANKKEHAANVRFASTEYPPIVESIKSKKQKELLNFSMIR